MIRDSDGQPIQGLYAIGEVVDTVVGIEPAFREGRRVVDTILGIEPAFREDRTIFIYQ